ncbi:MAG: V-type ATPase subunit [Clostridia bacterium]|nr:V-type ATPase subunit [Clostridia bacterium]
MALSYEYSVGSVRAKENALFHNADAEQMLALRDETQLARYLKDRDFGDGDTVDEILESNAQRTWEYLRSIAPDFAVFNPFFYQNDLHNLKTVLKGTMASAPYEALLIEPSTIPVSELKEAVENRRFDRLPSWISEAADAAYETLAHTKDARSSDALIDRAALEELLRTGKSSDSPFLREYLERIVFYADMKIAIRAARVGAGDYYLERAICEMDVFKKSELVSAVLKGEEALLKYLEKIPAYDARRAVESYRTAPAAFERFTDNEVMRLAKRLCKLSVEGADPMIGYMIGCDYDRKLVEMIASGLRMKSPPEVIRERLREIYG